MKTYPMKARIRDITAISDEHRHLAAIIEQWPLLVERISDITFKRWEKTRIGPNPGKKWGLTAGEAIHALYDGDAQSSRFDGLRGSIEALCCPKRASGDVRPTSIALGYKLRNFKHRVVGVRRFTSRTDRTHTESWAVEDATGEPENNVIPLKQ